mgnify:CR=1 FL=1
MRNLTITLSINYENLSEIQHDLKFFSKTKLIIVTKNQIRDDIIDLLDQGFVEFGENRVQEAFKKYDLDTRKKFQSFNLHLIGPLQSKKTSIALKLFDTIQTIDRKKIIDTIVKESEKLNFIRTKEYFIQVNIGQEPQKFGCMPDELLSLYEYAISSNLNIVGLMCIPPNDQNAEFYFQEINNLKNTIDKNLLLSMGMSGDYKVALKYDVKYIRIGSKIFT